MSTPPRPQGKPIRISGGKPDKYGNCRYPILFLFYTLNLSSTLFCFLAYWYESPCKKRACNTDYNDLKEDFDRQAKVVDQLKEKVKLLKQERDDASYKNQKNAIDMSNMHNDLQRMSRELANYQAAFRKLNNILSTVDCGFSNTSGRGTATPTTFFPEESGEYDESEKSQNVSIILFLS